MVKQYRFVSPFVRFVDTLNHLVPSQFADAISISIRVSPSPRWTGGTQDVFDVQRKTASLP